MEEEKEKEKVDKRRALCFFPFYFLLAPFVSHPKI